MNDVITIGEAMITFNPHSTGPLKFVNDFEKKVGGAELNVAIGCSRLGLQVGWISRLGKDEFGQSIRTFARGEGIDVSEVALVEGYPTSLNFKEIMEDGSGRTMYYRDHSPTSTMTPAELKPEYFREAKLLHITGIFPAVAPENMEVTMRAIALAKEYGLKIAFDPNIRLRLWNKEEAREALFPLLAHVDILLAGDEEMKVILGESDPHAMIEKGKELGISLIAIKRGEKGSVGYYNGEIVEAAPVKASKIADTVGAGDGFDAGMIYGFLQGWPLSRMLTFANTIGSMVVSIVGDNEGLPYLEDVQAKTGEIERVER
ncbi:sugar kinase [Shouchella shacheensis]|uniref:sugar kinase n=1 Tax=Shouchella shacheensis TaxID=1649580 RepID=UPI00073FFDC2|nr:sugar kinase [Shouchella shacheensis]